MIDLTRIEGEPFQFDVNIAGNEIDLESDFARLNGDISIRGELTKHIAQTDVVGEIDAKIEIDCTRCLQPVVQDLKIPFDVDFVTPEFDATARETELNQSDLETAVFEGDQVDLNELVREQILLNLPEQTFCSPDCKGLCPKCGQNRNLIDCNCEENETDPRWAALKDLK